MQRMVLAAIKKSCLILIDSKFLVGVLKLHVGSTYELGDAIK
jgi:hypothetical protein